ncbi:hypothetical protein [Lichenicoccus sp.]|uniref:hypothetical protein n=1 Tax=Lichenicoccus sp. TaxID=2781899 RepID=UPI003D105AAC
MRASEALALAEIMNGLPAAVTRTLGVHAGAAPRQSRRLPERILVAAHQACDLGDLDIALQLLSILETVIGQRSAVMDPGRRRVMESLIAAHQRLWHLRHAEAAGEDVATRAKQPLHPHGLHESPEPADFTFDTGRY